VAKSEESLITDALIAQYKSIHEKYLTMY